MPLTQLEAELRPIARERIATGQLPREVPTKMWGGPGSGQPCALCDKPIRHEEVELELEVHMDENVRPLRCSPWSANRCGNWSAPVPNI